MKSLQLIRSLYGLSSFLLYAEGGFVLLFLVFIPLMITIQSHTANSSSVNRRRVQCDTMLQTGIMGNREYIMPSADSKGQVIEKAKRRDSILVYYGEGETVVAKLRLDSLRRLLHPTEADNVPVAAHLKALAYQQSLTRQIDSVLIANPDVEVVRMPDRWMLQPRFPSGWTWTVTIPLYSDVWHPERDSPNLPQQWYRVLTYKPFVQLRQNLNSQLPMMLHVSVYRWSDLNSYIWPLIILGMIWLFLFLGVVMVVTQWFREIFADLLNGDFFGERIARRVQQSGWLFISSFVLNNIVDVFRPFLVDRYLRNQGYKSFASWNWSGPDHWFWLGAGLMLLVFAQIFRYGTQLQRESELTI